MILHKIAVVSYLLFLKTLLFPGQNLFAQDRAFASRETLYMIANQKGQSFKAKIVSVLTNEGKVRVLAESNGKTYDVPLDTLTSETLDLVNKWHHKELVYSQLEISISEEFIRTTPFRQNSEDVESSINYNEVGIKLKNSGDEAVPAFALKYFIETEIDYGHKVKGGACRVDKIKGRKSVPAIDAKDEWEGTTLPVKLGKDVFLTKVVALGGSNSHVQNVESFKGVSIALLVEDEIVQVFAQPQEFLSWEHFEGESEESIANEDADVPFGESVDDSVAEDSSDVEDSSGCRQAKALGDALVVVEGGEWSGSTGSGFLAKLKGRYFIFTNIHVIAGNERVIFKTMNGEEIRWVDNIFASANRDVAMIPLAEPEKFYEVIELFDDIVEIDDTVVVMGNSQGGGVVRRLEGDINGIGPDRIEVDAEFVSGNSGSPIVHCKSGQVVGIASYLVDYKDRSKWEKGTEFDSIRRFGYRLDGIKKWEQTNLARLNKEQSELNRYEGVLNEVLEVAQGIRQNKRVMTASNNSDLKIKHALTEFHRNYDNTHRANSTGNKRALEILKRNLLNEMNNARSRAQENVHMGYMKSSLEQLYAFQEGLWGYLDGVYSY